MLLEGAMDWTDLGLLVAGAILGYLVQVIGDGWRNVSDDHELWADLRSTTLEAQPGSVGTPSPFSGMCTCALNSLCTK